jgi:hypothetical protein
VVKSEKSLDIPVDTFFLIPYSQHRQSNHKPTYMNKTLTLLAVVLATAATSFAGTASSSKKVVVAPQQDLFRAGEVQVDAFVAGAAGNYNFTKGSTKNTTGMGGGLGLSYFLTKYFGIGIDDTIGSLNGNGQTYNSTQATLIGRLPIESWHLAPYALVGGGATWGGSAAQGNGSVGLGTEYRFNRSVGLFADSRYFYGNNGLSETLTRAGLRFIF